MGEKRPHELISDSINIPIDTKSTVTSSYSSFVKPAVGMETELQTALHSTTSSNAGTSTLSAPESEPARSQEPARKTTTGVPESALSTSPINALPSSPSSPLTSPYITIFETFRASLDAHHERRERVIKASRDITALSKKIIFALQRVRTLGNPIPAPISKTIQTHSEAISRLYKSILPDLRGTDAYRYLQQLSPGIQEHVEALLFLKYLTSGQLASLSELRAYFETLEEEGEEAKTGREAGGSGGKIVLTEEDYILGLLDMTGEVMKFAITSIATAGSVPKLSEDRNVLTDLQTIRDHLSILALSSGGGAGRFDRDFQGKMDVMFTSVDKVERALYGLAVRGSERPKGWMPDLTTRDPGEVELEGY